MERKEKVQLLADIQSGRKQIKDLMKPNYENLSTPELTRLHDGVEKIHNKETLNNEEESEFKVILGKLYSIHPETLNLCTPFIHGNRK